MYRRLGPFKPVLTLRDGESMGTARKMNGQALKIHTKLSAQFPR